MTPEKKDAAVKGDVSAQREWIIEEISEFYDALTKNNIDEIGEETIGLYRTAQQFPEVQGELLPFIKDIIKALNSFNFTEQFSKWKAKKDTKNQAKDVTSQSLKSFIEKINAKYDAELAELEKINITLQKSNNIKAKIEQEINKFLDGFEESVEGVYNLKNVDSKNLSRLIEFYEELHKTKLVSDGISPERYQQITPLRLVTKFEPTDEKYYTEEYPKFLTYRVVS